MHLRGNNNNYFMEKFGYFILPALPLKNVVVQMASNGVAYVKYVDPYFSTVTCFAFMG